MKTGGSGAILPMSNLGFEAVVLRFLKVPQTVQIFKVPPAARSIQPESLVTNHALHADSCVEKTVVLYH